LSALPGMHRRLPVRRTAHLRRSAQQADRGRAAVQGQGQARGPVPERRYLGRPVRTNAMICPTCGYDNLPGNEECSHCKLDLAPLDQPMAHDRVERSLMEDPISIL